MRKTNVFSKRLSLAAVAAMSVSLLSADLVFATGSNLPYVEKVDLNLGNPQAILGLKNESTSGKLSDFKLEIINSHITFAGLSGKLVCGDHGQVKHGDPTRPSKPNGKPKLTYGFVNKNVNAPIYSVDQSEFMLDIYERKGAAKWKGHKKTADGNGPYNFNIPVSKLKQPGKETSLDAIQYFNNRLQEHMDGGGSKMEFLRSDQAFVIPAFLTLQAECWSGQGHVAYDVKQVSVLLRYTGDKSLKYTPAVELGGNNTAQQPFLVTDAKIAVTPAQSTGQCPRTIPANADIAFNHSSPTKRTIQVRFLEDGQPVSSWKHLSFKNKDTLSLNHMISVKAEKKAASVTPLAKLAQPKGQAGVLTQPDTIKQKSTVGIEVKGEAGSYKMAVAHYVANCTPVKKMTPVLAVIGKPDLTSREGMVIGHKTSSWGGHLHLQKMDFTAVTPLGCRARFAYDVVNIGKADAAGFKSRLRRSGQSTHLKAGMMLPENKAMKVSGNLLLPAGSYPLTVSIDDGKTVVETKENNNIFKIMVSVPKECGGGYSRPQ